MAIEITVQEVRQPAAGKRTGIVADTTGKWWLVWPNMLSQFRPGGTYSIDDYSTSEFKGKTYYTVKAASPSAAPPRPVSVVTNAPNSAYDNARRLDIFVCGAFNNLMANPNVSPNDMTMMDMVDVLHKLKGAWNGVFGPSPLPQRTGSISTGVPANQSLNQSNDMNDDIPF